jgi:hypothetical protein
MEGITVTELREIRALELYAEIDQRKEDMIREFGKELIGKSARNCSLRFMTERILHIITKDQSFLNH